MGGRSFEVGGCRLAGGESVEAGSGTLGLLVVHLADSEAGRWQQDVWRQWRMLQAGGG